jgi:predicted phage replisome organizer
MADNQKYYYMRLKEGFFEEDAIKIIEGMPDGYLYSNILLKLYLKSLKYNGKLMFNDRIPYNPTVLATITGHQVGTVEKALNLFETLDLIEVLDNGAIYMLDVQKLIGRSSTEAERKKAYRAKIEAEKAALLPDGQMSGQCPPEIEKEIEIETEIEKETDSVPESDPPQKAAKKKSKQPEYVEHPDLNSAIIAFVDYRKKIKKPMTEKAVELMIDKLNKFSPHIEEQIEILNQSILNGWQGIFPLKKENYSSSARSANIQNRVSNIDNW